MAERANESHALAELNKSRQHKMEKGKTSRQYLVAAIGNLAAFSAGTALGWTSPTLPKLKDENNNLGFKVTEDEGSWIGALIAAGAAIGPFVAGIMAEKIGRKMTLLVSAVPFLLAWILAGTAVNAAMVMVARFIFGLGVGFVFTVLPMYIGEISTDEVRGALGSFMQLFITVGLLYSYAIGPYVSYLVLVIVSAVIPVAFLIAFFFMPESPHYYLAKNRIDDASKSLMFLRGKSAEGVKDELDAIKQSVDESMANAGSIKDLVATKGNIKALYLSCGLVAAQQLSGINVVLFYGETIFEKTKTNLSGAVCIIIIGVVQVLASSCTPLLVERLGKRILLMISGIGMTVGLGALGAFFLLDYNKDPVKDQVLWLPIASMVIYMIVYCIGFGPLPWAVMGELFPPNVKSKASTCTASFCWLLAFFITKYFEDLDRAIGSHFAFWIFAVFCVIFTAFVFFLLPETKGKSLQEIQDELNGVKSSGF